MRTLPAEGKGESCTGPVFSTIYKFGSIQFSDTIMSDGYFRTFLTDENLSSKVCKHQRRRPACASAQSDQHLCYSLIEKYNT